MGLVRLVIQRPDGQPFQDVGVGLNSTDTGNPSVPAETKATDKEGVARFRVAPGTYKVSVNGLPEGIVLPKYGTTVRLEDFAEGIEQIVRLVNTPAR